MLIIMILVMSLWQNGGVARDIVSYVMDIAVIISFWEALTIMIAENKERRDGGRNLMERFDSIRFYQK